MTLTPLERRILLHLQAHGETDSVSLRYAVRVPGGEPSYGTFYIALEHLRELRCLTSREGNGGNWMGRFWQIVRAGEWALGEE